MQIQFSSLNINIHLMSLFYSLSSIYSGLSQIHSWAILLNNSLKKLICLKPQELFASLGTMYQWRKSLIGLMFKLDADSMQNYFRSQVIPSKKNETSILMSTVYCLESAHVEIASSALVPRGNRKKALFVLVPWGKTTI